MRGDEVVLGLMLSALVIACGEMPSVTEPSQPPVIAAMARSMNARPAVQAAQFIEGSCFFTVAETDGEVTGYSGTLQMVTTSSGRTSYHCKAEILSGPGLGEQTIYRDVTFIDSFAGPLFPCTVTISTAKGRQAMVTCTV